MIPHTEGLASTGATVEGILEMFETISDQITDKVASRQTLTSFAPLVEAIVAAAQGDQAMIAMLEPVLAARSATPLIAVLHRILAGERGAALTRGLDSVEGSIVDAILDKLQHSESDADQQPVIDLDDS